jgi:hypothetical protein
MKQSTVKPVFITHLHLCLNETNSKQVILKNTEIAAEEEEDMFLIIM